VCTRTYGPPDEHWQAPEVAHGWVFNRTGYVTWEWWPPTVLRGAAHPAFVALSLLPLRAAGGAAPAWAVALAPRLQAGLLSAAGDVAVMEMAYTLYGDADTALLAGVLHAVHAFGAWAGSRSLSNTLEWALFGVGLAAWAPALVATKSESAGGAALLRRAAVRTSLAAALGVLARPTALLPWTGVALVTAARLGWRTTGWLGLTAVLPIAAAVLAGGAVVDRALLGVWTSPLLSFVRFNVGSGLDGLYGTHAPAWYLTAGLPLAVGGLLPLALLGVWPALNGAGPVDMTAKLLVGVGGLMLAVLSLAGHKEHRFLLPLLPLFAVAAARGAANARARLSRTGARMALGLFLAANAAVAGYLSLVHQRGPVAAAEYVRLVAGQAAQLDRLEIHWLMPCHSAPYYDVVHWPVRMLQLDCSPGSRVDGLRGRFREAVCSATGCCNSTVLPLLSESDSWVHDPPLLLRGLYGPNPAAPAACGPVAPAAVRPAVGEAFATVPTGWAAAAAAGTCGVTSPPPAYRALPSHAILFDTDASLPAVSAWLRANSYVLDTSFFHAHVWGDAHRVGSDPGRVMVWRHPCWRERSGAS